MNEISGVIILLVRLAFKLIPPGMWLGAVFIVVLWLVVMVKVWRADGRPLHAQTRRQLPDASYQSPIMKH
ncbi:MAG TPA: hypothetical protein EYH05_10575 [Anaerolineae bacterium]|nr:hypothetical protein [Anaerolineae bacterium]